MKTRVGIMLLIALAVAGCQKNERAATPLTGVSGASVISGDVQMADGSSPAGVEVSLRGTGMTTVLAEDGRFAFGSAPEEAELLFRRASDAVEASMKTESNAGHLQIELAKREAKHGGRRRGVGRGAKVREYEGLIVSADATQLVMFTSKKEEVTIAIVPQTVIRHGGTLLTAADLTPDTRVHVKARTVEDVLTAVQVIVQNDDEDDDSDDGDDDEPAVRREYEGIVVSTTDAQIVLLDSHREEVTFNVTPATIIRKGNRTVALADIEAGWRLHVRTAPAADGTLDALVVIVQNTGGSGEDEPSTVRVNGQIASVGTVDLVVTTDDGDVTVQTDGATTIRKQGASATLAELAVGDKVPVKGVSVSDGVVLATEIEVKK